MLWVCAASAVERVELMAGGAEDAGGPALREPYGVAFDSDGRLIIAEMAKGQRILRREHDGTLVVIAGTGETGDGGDGGPARQAAFNGIHGICLLPDDGLLVADTWNCRLRRIDLGSGVVTAFAGTGEKGCAGDGGPARAARFGGVYSVALGGRGRTVFVADLDNRRVRAIDLRTGRMSTFAGNGAKGVPPDGAAAADAPLVDPRAVASDAAGNVYILERGGHALRAVDPSGRIQTVVNRSGRKGADGDGGPAIDAAMNGPKHLCVDRNGDVLIADAENHLIRRYQPSDGKIVRVAGCGRKGAGGVGGPPDAVELNRPHGVCIGPDGAVYIADSYNHRVVRIVRTP